MPRDPPVTSTTFPRTEKRSSVVRLLTVVLLDACRTGRGQLVLDASDMDGAAMARRRLARVGLMQTGVRAVEGGGSGRPPHRRVRRPGLGRRVGGREQLAFEP